MTTYYSEIGDESYGGSVDADQIYTASGNDTVSGASGDDLLFGGPGTDTAKFAGVSAGYRFGWSASRGALTVSDADPLSAGDDGADCLVDMERLQFDDRTYSVTQGGEIRLSQYQTSEHRSPSIAGLASGGFAVAFQYGYAATSVYEIDHQLLDSGSQFVASFGSELRANTTSTGDQQQPTMAALTGGGYVVAWQSYPQDGSGYGIYFRRYGADGAPAGTETLANTTTALSQRFPAATGLLSGGFVVAWQSPDGDGDGIFAQRFDANGTPVGTETRINDAIATTQSAPAIGSLQDGGYVVTWTGADASGSGIWQRRVSADGMPVGSDALANTTTANTQTDSAVAGLADGGHVVVWESFSTARNSYGIYFQRYAVSGIAVGAETRVDNAGTSTNAVDGSVAGTSQGGFVVAWTQPDANGLGVYFTRYDASGTALNSPTRVNTHETANQGQSAVAAVTDGGFVIAWESYNQGLSGYNLFAQRYDAEGRPVLATITGGDGDDPLDASTSAYALELRGGAGDDTLSGGSGNDILTGGDGVDVISGGSGIDTASYEGSTSRVVASTGSGIAVDGHISDGAWVEGGSSEVLAAIENLEGGQWNDALYGDAVSNVLSGNGGDDGLYGLNGDDCLNGGTGNDFLHGGMGNDTLIGGFGCDVLFGGHGSDSFVFSMAPNVSDNLDTLKDFQSGIDKIVLENLVFGAVGGSGALEGSHFRAGAGVASAADADDYFIYDSTSGTLYYDSDGSGAVAPIPFALLTGHPTLAAGDFLFT